MQIFAALAKRDDDTTAAPPAAARLLAGFVLVMAAAGSALGQGSVPCTAIQNDNERLACYDRALRGGAAPAATPAPAPVAAPPPAADAPTLGTNDQRSERRIRSSAATPAPAAPTVNVPPAGGNAGRGNGDELIPIVVVNVRALPGREATFTDRDGTRWVQTDSQRIINLPDAPFDANLKRGAMGSFFLVPEEGRAIRVRQVR
jgi:hypothetical protein